MFSSPVLTLTPAQEKLVRAMTQSLFLHWCGIFIVVAVAGWTFLVRPVQEYRDEVRDKIESAEQTLMKTQMFLGDGESFEAAFRRMENQRVALEKKVLRSGGQSMVIDFLTLQAAEAGLDIRKIGLAETLEEPSGRRRSSSTQKFRPVRFTLEMEGEYQPLGLFFESLEEAPVFFAVENLDIRPASRHEGRLSAQVTISAYEAVS